MLNDNLIMRWLMRQLPPDEASQIEREAATNTEVADQIYHMYQLLLIQRELAKQALLKDIESWEAERTNADKDQNAKKTTATKRIITVLIGIGLLVCDGQTKTQKPMPEPVQAPGPIAVFQNPQKTTPAKKSPKSAKKSLENHEIQPDVSALEGVYPLINNPALVVTQSDDTPESSPVGI